MQITLVAQPFAAIVTEALVTYAFEESDPVQGRIAEIDQAAGSLLCKLGKSGELTGKMLEFTLVHAPAGLKATRLLLVGAGKREQFSGAALRKIVGAALRYLKSRSVKNFALLVREGGATEENAQTIAEGALAADFESDKYKTDKKNGKNIESVQIAGYSDSESAAGEKGLSKGRIIADAQNFARDLINEPSNKLTPRVLAEKAEAMAREAGLAVEILDEKKIADLKMGALLSVAQGGPEPPRVMVVTYTPAKPKPGAPVIGLVGKAQKPGDIQTAMSGKTIEVLNTDAEGRLILADGVHYAKQLGATHLVDAATLTGAIVVALANINVGVFGSDQPFTDKLLASSKAVGEKMWQMPVDDDYREFIKGTVADIQNIGSGKGGGAITGAMFIKEFTGDTPWIHLDIAGTAWNDDAKPWLAKGPTGVALRTLVHLILSY